MTFEGICTQDSTLSGLCRPPDFASRDPDRPVSVAVCPGDVRMAGNRSKRTDTALDSIEQMFYLDHPMATLSPNVTAAVTSLQARWGSAAPRVAGAPGAPGPSGATGIAGTAPITDGALALAPATAPAPDQRPTSTPTPRPNPTPAQRPTPGRDERIIPTGFAALDAILGPGGLPRSASVAIRGDGSSGRTTLVLRLAAEAQAAGSIVAWLDLSRSFDPVEAVARGIRLEWLVVITPETLDEGLAIGGALLAGRSVDLLVLDLPGGRLAATDRPTHIADRLGRLAALARRSETLFVVLEPPAPARGSPGALATAVAAATGLRLELARRSWIRLGRDIVGQRTEALVARNRYGPPGRRATLRILYAEGGERDACLGRDDLLHDELEAPDPAPAIHERTHIDATPPSPPAAPPPRTRSGTSLRALPARSARPGRPALDPRLVVDAQPGGPGPGHPARDAARERPPARAGSDLHRPGPRRRRGPRSRRRSRLAAVQPGDRRDHRPDRCRVRTVRGPGRWPARPVGAEPVLVGRDRCARRSRACSQDPHGPGSPAPTSARRSPPAWRPGQRPSSCHPVATRTFLAPLPAGLLTRGPGHPGSPRPLRPGADRCRRRPAPIGARRALRRGGRPDPRPGTRRGDRAVPAAPDPGADAPRGCRSSPRSQTSSHSASCCVAWSAP